METWFRLPREVRLLSYAAVGFAVAVLACLAWDFDRLHNGSRVGGWLVLAAVIGLLVGAFVDGGDDRFRRNFGSFDQYIAYRRALATGELPACVEPDVWRGWLSSGRCANRMQLLWAGLLVVFGVLPSLSSQSAYWVTASAFGLLALRNSSIGG
jgi:hypothetical protein